MNERIRELAKQAKGFVDLNQHVGGTNGCMVYTYDGLEKFAELIIQECAYVAEDEGTARDSCCAITADRIVRQIKKHFGVEE